MPSRVTDTTIRVVTPGGHETLPYVERVADVWFAADTTPGSTGSGWRSMPRRERFQSMEPVTSR